MAEYPFASIAAGIACPRLRQTYANAARSLTHLDAHALLRVVQKNRWAFDR